MGITNLAKHVIASAAPNSCTHSLIGLVKTFAHLLSATLGKLYAALLSKLSCYVQCNKQQQINALP